MTWPPSALYYRLSGMPSLHTAVCLDCPHLGSSPLALLAALCWAPACSARSLNSLFVFAFLLPPGLEPIPYIPAVIEILLQIKQTLWIHLNVSSPLHAHEMEGLRSPYWPRVSFSCSTLWVQWFALSSILREPFPEAGYPSIWPCGVVKLSPNSSM